MFSKLWQLHELMKRKNKERTLSLVVSSTNSMMTPPHPKTPKIDWHPKNQDDHLQENFSFQTMSATGEKKVSFVGKNYGRALAIQKSNNEAYIYMCRCICLLNCFYVVYICVCQIAYMFIAN